MRYCIIVYFPYSQNSSGKSKKEISLKKKHVLKHMFKKNTCSLHVLLMSTQDSNNNFKIWKFMILLKS
jgi:hypothetical protein